MVEAIIKERNDSYGSFETTAIIAQDFKAHITANVDKLTDTQAEALEMIATKMARILNGDPNKIDSWKDIAGYATLAINGIQRAKSRVEGIGGQEEAVTAQETDNPDATKI